MGAAGACWAEAGKAAADEASEAEVWAEDEECGMEQSWERRGGQKTKSAGRSRAEIGGAGRRRRVREGGELRWMGDVGALRGCESPE